MSKEIKKAIDIYLERINKIIDQSLPESNGNHSSLHEAMRYSTLNGGKRIRPIITLLAAESVGQIDENVYAGACAIELLHTESVIHDDIIDNETQRRHKDPFHIKYGYNTSVLTGDFVLGLILNISSRLDKARVTKDLATAAMLMSEGEVLEGKLEESEDVTFEDYIKVMDYKTATAFEMAAKLGAVIGGGSEEEISGLAEYGKNIGIAYQIKDDLMDWKNEDKLFNLLVKKSSDPRVVFNKMEELLKSYAEKASESLRKIRDSDSKHNLEELVSFTDFKA